MRAKFLALFGCLICASAGTVQASTSAWEGWRSGYYFYYYDYATNVAEARVNAYQTVYSGAVDRNSAEDSRRSYLALNQVKGDLIKLQNESRRLDAEIERLETNGRALDRLVYGAYDDNTQTAFSYFLKTVGPDVVGIVSEVVEPLPEEAFELRTKDPDNRLEAFPGGNMLQFLGWLRARPLAPTSGGPAHDVLLRLRAKLMNAGDAWLNELKNRRAALEEAGPWQAVPSCCGVLGLPARDAPADFMTRTTQS